MKHKLLLYVTPCIISVLCCEVLFLNINFRYKQPFQKNTDIYFEEMDSSPTKKSNKQENALETEADKGLFQITRGLLSRISLLSQVLNDIKDPVLPPDGKIDQSIDRLERVLLAQKIYLFMVGFFLILCISAIISIVFEAWFSVFLGRFIYISSAYIILWNILKGIIISFTSVWIGILVIAFYIVFYILNSLAMIKLDKLIHADTHKFNALLRASNNEEDSHGERAYKPIVSIEKILFHLFIIIFIGVLIGNLLYIPLFSLQKNYSSEFGFLLLFMLINLSLFYIWNYYKIGQEPGLSTFQNIISCFSFLQYRFIKNFVFIVLSTAGIIIFVVFLFTLLTLNTFFLKNYVNMIENTINL